jgi:flagellar capping protein FliD
MDGQRLLAGMNSTLVRNLNGGNATSFGDGMVSFNLADGSGFTSDLSGLADGSVSELISKIEADSGGLVRARINDAGTGLLITDTTRAGGGTNPLIISGTGGMNTAAALGIETDPAGVNTATYSGSNLQHAYIGSASPLSALNGGSEVGTGTIVITDATGAREEFIINKDVKTVGDLIRRINSATTINVTAAINDNGDGIIVRADGAGTGQAITISDSTGAVARNVGIRGTASGEGPDNYIDGTLETTVEFDPGDTLEDVVRKINEADPIVSASILNTGVGTQPFKISLTARDPGRDGRFVMDTNGFNLGLETLDKGEDAVVFFGGSDPASAQLLTSSTNTIEGVVQGVTIDLKSKSEEPVELTVTRDNETIETDVKAFIEAFNTVIDRIDFNTRYDEESEAKGPLLGDATMIGLRTVLFNTVFGEAQSISGQYSRLFDVGLTVEDGGKIGLDLEKFRAALEEDAASVEALFAERTLKKKEPQPLNGSNPNILVSNPNQGDEFTSLGVAGQLEELARRYINSVDGVLTIKNRSIDDRIAVQNRRIELINSRLEDRRSILEAQFVAMERAIAQLQQQQGALQSIG